MATTHIVEIRVVASGSRAAQQQIEGIGKSARAAAGALQLFRNFLVLKAIGNVVGDVVKVADSFTILSNKLKATVSDGANIRELQHSIVDMAFNSRTSVEAVATAFSRFSLGAKDAGVSSERLLGIIDTMTKQIQLSGATSTEASNAMIQLSQGFASGVLRGDELRSVMEQLPTVARSIAESMGVAVGELRNLGREGKITTDILIKSFEDTKQKTEEAFQRMTPTIQQSLDQLGISFQEFIGGLENAKGPIAGFFSAIAHGIRMVNAELFPNNEQKVTQLERGVKILEDLRGKNVLQRLSVAPSLTGLAGIGDLPITNQGLDAEIANQKKLVQAQKDLVEQEKFGADMRRKIVKEQAAGNRPGDPKIEDLKDELHDKLEIARAGGNRERFIQSYLTRANIKAETAEGKILVEQAGQLYDLNNARKESNQILSQTPQIYSKLRNLEAQVSPLAAVHDKLTDAQEAFNNAAKAGVDTVLPLAEIQKRYTRDVLGVGNATTDYEEGVQLLNEALADTTITQAEFNLETSKMQEAYESAANSMLKSIDPLFAANESLKRSMEELDVARERGIIDADMEAEILQKLARNQTGVGNAVSDFTGKKAVLDQQMKLGNVEVAEYNVQLRTLTEELSGAAISFVEATSPLAKFNTDVAKAKEMLARENVTGRNVDPAAAAEALTRYKRELAGLGNELTDNTEKQQVLDRARADGTRMTVEEYQKAKNKLLLEEANLRTDAGAGVDRFFLKMQENAMTNADFVEEAFTQTFATMGDAMTDFIETGKLDFQGLVDSIIKDLSRLATQKFMDDLFGQMGGGEGGSGGLGNLLNQGLASIGSMFGGPVGNPGTGVGVGNELSTGGTQATMGGLELTGFASGGSFEVGAGTSIGTAAGQYDNRLIAFRAHDGEQVTINKPGQGGGSSGNVTFVLPGVTNYEDFKRSSPQIASKMHTVAAVAARRMK